MLTLLLLRHAKAEKPTPEVSDTDRKLKRRGQVAARAIGRYLAASRLVPERVLCSPAARTRETWEIVAGEFKHPPAPVFDPGLYDFGDGQALLARILAEDSGASPLMLVGHNPSTEELALRLIAPGGDLRRQMEIKYPTAGLAVLRFAADRWRYIAPGSGEILAFVRPADLIREHED
jgi:phosphohistidine phosphatase